LHNGNIIIGAGVAPRTGARIETSALLLSVEAAVVAPRTGARIETATSSTV